MIIEVHQDHVMLGDARIEMRMLEGAECYERYECPCADPEQAVRRACGAELGLFDAETAASARCTCSCPGEGDKRCTRRSSLTPDQQDFAEAIDWIRGRGAGQKATQAPDVVARGLRALLDGRLGVPHT